MVDFEIRWGDRYKLETVVIELRNNKPFLQDNEQHETIDIQQDDSDSIHVDDQSEISVGCDSVLLEDVGNDETYELQT